MIRCKHTNAKSVIYERRFTHKRYPDSFFAFPCTKDGTVLTDQLQPAGLANFENCRSGAYQVIDEGVHRMEVDRTWILHDARGIPCRRVCADCVDAVMATYRPEIFTDPSYHTDEPIEEYV